MPEENGLKPSPNAKFVISIIQWLISVLAIPALVWAWNLSVEVQLLEQQVQNLQITATKSEQHSIELVKMKEQHSIELAKMNEILNNLKENVDEIKRILRE